MALNNPTNEELEIIEYILRPGNAVPEKRLKIKCEHKKIDYEKFLNEWNDLISVKISRSEKTVTINNINDAMNILINNGRKLISHYSRRSRRY